MSSAMLTALENSILYPAVFVNIGFASSTAYVWSGVGSIFWNGQTYTGVGDLGQISVIEEAGTVEAKGIALTLSGIDPTMLANAIQENQLGLPVIVYLALYTGAGGTIIAQPLIAWQGFTDQPMITISGQTAEITIKSESVLALMNQPVDRRYTLEDSQIQTAGELGFQAVASISEITIQWGQQASSTQNV